MSAACHAQSSISTGGLISSTLRKVVQWFGGIATTIRHRREIASLLHADRAMLRDLGITESDVVNALSAPAWSDPSAQLADRARETHASARIAAHDNFVCLGKSVRMVA